jgi:hypothetical protein
MAGVIIFGLILFAVIFGPWLTGSIRSTSTRAHATPCRR